MLGDVRDATLRIVAEQLTAAANAPKCHRCGCLQETVAALEGTPTGGGELAVELAEARAAFLPREYDCLGCPVCHPALAANAFTEAFPDEGEGLALCPTEAPPARKGWPPLAGAYHVLRFRAPVAICTLNSDGLAERLGGAAPSGVAIVGTLRTENLGIERIIRNVLADPNIRFLVVCGEDAQQAIGHLPGQSLASLLEGGIDERGRIVGAQGKRPVLKNVSPGQVAAFRRQITLMDLIGEVREPEILARVRNLSAQDPGPFDGAAPADRAIEPVSVDEPRRLVPDPGGYFVIFPDAARRLLALEHYTTAGVLDCVLEGRSPASLFAAAIERGLLTRLDHAAYLGRELARAEDSLKTGAPYVQDRAPGEVAEVRIADCGCGAACGNITAGGGQVAR